MRSLKGKGHKVQKRKTRGVSSSSVPGGKRLPAYSGAGARRVATLAAGVTLLATACTGQQAPQAKRDNGAQPSVSSFAHAPKGYPLSAFMTDIEERQTVDRAISVLVNRCMKKFDLSWPEYEPSPGNIPENARKYGVTDLESVHVYGYKPPLPDGVSKQEAISFRKRYEAKQKAVTPAMEGVYSGRGGSARLPLGVPEGGCSGEARRQAMADSVNEDMMTVQTLFWQASASTSKDPRTKELNRRWSACMKRSGMTYPDPLAAVDDPAWRKAKTAREGPSPYFPAPSEKEIRTAEADVRCKNETDYIKKRSDIEVQYQRALIKRNEKKLAAVKVRKQQVMRKLYSITGGPGAAAK